MFSNPGIRKIAIRVVSLADQLAFSAANFLLTIILARHYSEMELSAYGMGLSIALMIQGVQWHCYVVRNSILSPSVFRRRSARVLGEHLIIWGITLTLEFVIFSVILFFGGGPYYQAILGSAVVCSLIYAQLDFDRIVLIKHSKYIDMFLASAAFLTMNGILFFAIPHFHISFLGTMAIVGFFAAGKIMRLILIIGRPDFFWGWRMAMADYKKYFPSSFTGVAVYSGFSHIPLLILGSVAPPIQAAAFVAARSLMQPLQVVIRSLDMIDKNFFQQKAAMNPADIRTVMLRQLATYALLSGTMIGVVLFFSEPIIYFAYGEKYVNLHGVLVGMVFLTCMFAVTLPLETVIVKMKRLPRYNYYRSAAGIIGCTLALFLCAPYGAWGAIMACLGGWMVSIACALWIIRDILFARANALPENKSLL